MNIQLFMLQSVCMSVAGIMALQLALSRLLIRQTHASYERARWILFAAMSLLTVYYVLQMAYGLRASGDDVGAVVNILFYSPVFFLVSYAMLSIECPGESLRIHRRVGLVGYVLILVVFFTGWMTHGSFHLRAALYVMLGLFVLCMGYFIFASLQAIRRKSHQVEDSTGDDIQTYVLFVRSGFLLLCASALFLPFSILSSECLFVVGPLLLLAIIAFTLSFLALGNDLPLMQTVMDETDGLSFDDMPRPAGAPALSEGRIAEIERAIEAWRQRGGYQDHTLTLASLSLLVRVDRRDFAVYLSERQHCSFRIWLSNLRFLEAQRLMREHPDYGNDEVSAACGFASRSNLYKMFKDKTGMSPGEWREKNS